MTLIYLLIGVAYVVAWIWCAISISRCRHLTSRQKTGFILGGVLALPIFLPAYLIMPNDKIVASEAIDFKSG